MYFSGVSVAEFEQVNSSRQMLRKKIVSTFRYSWNYLPVPRDEWIIKSFLLYWTRKKLLNFSTGFQWNLVTISK